jgi:beta-glucanase (GH16 family)
MTEELASECFRRTVLPVAAALIFCASEVAAHDPYGVKGEWELVFSDDFDAPPAPQTWTRCYWWDDKGCTNLGNHELQWYVPNNVFVSDGKLVLRAKRESVPGYKGKIYDYTSGMVTSGRNYSERAWPDRFATTYGYFEIRARVPAGKGLWSAFWLLPSTHKSKPEIDVMEVLGHAPDTLEMHAHYRDDKGESQNPGSEAIVPDMSKDFHVFAVDWGPDAIIWYFDGQEKWRYSVKEHISHEPMYVLLNLAVGGEWPGSPEASTVFPADFLIDYIRIWKRLDDG